MNKTDRRNRILALAVLTALMLADTALTRPVYAEEESILEEETDDSVDIRTGEMQEEAEQAEEDADAGKRWSVSIVLRPEKTEGEADPDLTEEVRRQVEAAVESGGTKDAGTAASAEDGTDQGESGRSLVDRICSLISWSYSYDETVTEPGFNRPAGISPIRLDFGEDGICRFDPDPDEDSESYLTTHENENSGEEERKEGENTGENGGEEEETEGIKEDSGEMQEADAGLGELEDESVSEDIPAEEGENAERDTVEKETESGENIGNNAENSGGNGYHEPDYRDYSGNSGEYSAGQEDPGQTGEETGDGTEAHIIRLDEEKLLEETIIEGVEDGHSYSGEVAPSVTLADGEYAQAEVTLRRSSLEESDVDVTDRFILSAEGSESAAGQKEDIFEAVPENDGLYRLEVAYRDDAGNTVTKKISFTVNRFGSVYVCSDALLALRDACVRSVAETLTISEYNPDPLVEDSFEIEITRNGVPLKNVKYTVSREEEPEDRKRGGWYRYDYRIEPSNFSKDGVYRISVSSKDLAGNRPESVSSGGEIRFCVDSKAPSIRSLKGLEEDFVHADRLTVNYEITDETGLSFVAVYVDGAIVRKITEFDDPSAFSGNFEIGEGVNRHVRIVAEDKAGNILDTDRRNEAGTYLFAPVSPFVRDITVTGSLPAAWLRCGGAKAVLSVLAAAVFSAAAAAYLAGHRKRRRYGEDVTKILR